MNTFGKRLKEIRTKHNLSQSQIGEMMGVSGAYISKLELRDEIPSDTFIYLFCQLFHVRKEWLMKGEYPIQKPPETIADEITRYLDYKSIVGATYHLYSKFEQPSAIPPEIVALKEAPKRDKHLSMIMDYLETLWNTNQDMQGWLKVQFGKAFPDFEDYQKKQLGIRDEDAATGA